MPQVAGLGPLLKRLRDVDERMPYVIEARFGLIDGREHTLEEVGQHVGGLSRERTRQIEQRALRLLTGFASEAQRPGVVDELHSLRKTAHTALKPHRRTRRVAHVQTATTPDVVPKSQTPAELWTEWLQSSARCKALIEQIAVLTKELEHERERYVDLGKRAMQVSHSLWDQTIIGFGSARTVDHAVSNGHLKPVDGRSIPNPIRNLKISVSRMHEWAKRDKKPMDEAREHAIRSITDRAITLFHLDGLPAEVEKYIDKVFA